MDSCSDGCHKTIHQPPDDKPPDDLGKIFDSWNAFAEANGLKRVLATTPARTESIRELAKCKSPPLELNKVFAEIKKSKYLLGKKDRKPVEFDFVFSAEKQKNGADPYNFVKILEGKYADGNENSDGLQAGLDAIDALIEAEEREEEGKNRDENGKEKVEILY